MRGAGRSPLAHAPSAPGRNGRWPRRAAWRRAPRPISPDDADTRGSTAQQGTRSPHRAGFVIVGMAGIAEIQPAAPGERLMAARPRRYHAVEHVDAAGDGLGHILGFAHAHEIARPIVWQH